MDEILNYLNQMFEAKAEHLKSNFDQYVPLQGGIKALAAITHEQPETAVMNIYVFEKDVESEVGFLAENLINGSKKYSDYSGPEQKNRNKQLENEYRQLKSTEYMNRYGRNNDKVYYTLIKESFIVEILSAINQVICNDPRVRQQLSLINVNKININELKPVLFDMAEYYASQCSDYKPVKAFINKAWNNENISIVGTGASGAIWGAILGGPVGMVAGAALAGMWADGKKKETYRNTRETYIQNTKN